MSVEMEDGQQRRSKRSHVLLVAKVTTADGQVLEVRLRNLSQSGALLEAAGAPPVDTLVTFERGPTAVAGRVAWRREGRFGIAFVHPIPEEEVLLHVGKLRTIADAGRSPLNTHRLLNSPAALTQRALRPS